MIEFLQQEGRLLVSILLLTSVNSPFEPRHRSLDRALEKTSRCCPSGGEAPRMRFSANQEGVMFNAPIVPLLFWRLITIGMDELGLVESMH